MTGVLAGYTYIKTVVPVNILGDGYPNKTINFTPYPNGNSRDIKITDILPTYTCTSKLIQN